MYGEWDYLGSQSLFGESLPFGAPVKTSQAPICAIWVAPTTCDYVCGRLNSGLKSLGPPGMEIVNSTIYRIPYPEPDTSGQRYGSYFAAPLPFTGADRLETSRARFFGTCDPNRLSEDCTI